MKNFKRVLLKYILLLTLLIEANDGLAMVIPPLNQGEKEAALIIIPGTDISPRGYLSLATKIQESTGSASV